MITLLILACSTLTIDARRDQTQLEKYLDEHRLRLEGKDAIIETAPDESSAPGRWVDISLDTKSADNMDVKLMTDVIHDTDGHRPRCFGPSCQEGFDPNIGPHEDIDEYLAEHVDKSNYDANDRLEAINALAEKLKNVKLKDKYISEDDLEYGGDNNGKIYTSWNRLKVKQHKHPYDDKDGWVTLEPVAWSTSKISKWKPNVKKQKPNHWIEEEADGFPSNSPNSYKRPSMSRPTYINNKLHSNSDWDSDSPKPWTKPSYNYPSTWTSDDSRRPQKPNCDNDEHYHTDPTVFYGLTDSIVTDNRPSHFPYEYESLKKPIRRPTQVVYSGSPETDGDRSRPPHGDGQWVLLSTTRGYRNKKRQRSLVHDADSPTLTSHQAVSLTVLPVAGDHTNMTTSHGGLLEVDRSFQTVEESKRDMDRKKLEDVPRPLKRIVKKRLVTSVAPDSTSVLAAVGAGMVPATMAMVVPMMLGRRRRDLSQIKEERFYKKE
ncbi:hypothetical protein EVAR_21808_1 [Eumeta japonica]|uniref:Uncharacterized protein n=1 Tax=Eumeta variegata TaxID=151549 RepID=A0A4C1YJ89_EUMVA|nr:hypothetical protein EVAR_21808_1 [Eumeta japonica]